MPVWANPLPGHKSYCNYGQWRGTYSHRGEDIPGSDPWNLLDPCGSMLVLAEDQVSLTLVAGGRHVDRHT